MTLTKRGWPRRNEIVENHINTTSRAIILVCIFTRSLAFSATNTASPFTTTVANKVSNPGAAPDGMVWIPGGEFSMGSDVASEALCGLPGVTVDSQPIHRVDVDGFWMDKAEASTGSNHLGFRCVPSPAMRAQVNSGKTRIASSGPEK